MTWTLWRESGNCSALAILQLDPVEYAHSKEESEVRLSEKLLKLEVRSLAQGRKQEGRSRSLNEGSLLHHRKKHVTCYIAQARFPR